jgi:hypothetical protein
VWPSAPHFWRVIRQVEFQTESHNRGSAAAHSGKPVAYRTALN